MSELSDESSETELLNRSLSMWHGFEQLVGCEDLDVPLDLHTASSIGQYDVVKQCIQSGKINPNQKNRGGWTPLMYASYIGHDTVVHLLLEAGVDVNMTTEKGQSALMLAASCGNESIAYFLLQQGAELELKDHRGWTALFHCTSTGHQQMVKFLLDNGADANLKEPVYGFTPLMEAAASGHEIIVQYLLNHDVQVDVKDKTGDTARSLALMYGYMKIASLIDLHTAPVSKSVRRDTGIDEDFSSSDESCSFQPHHPHSRHPHSRRNKGPSIHDGPQALAHITSHQTKRWPQQYESVPPQGYVTFKNNQDEDEEDIRNRDVTSPINEQDIESNSSREENPFCITDTVTTRKSSDSSGEGLAKPLGVSREGSLESNEDSDQSSKSSIRKQRIRRGHSRSTESTHSGGSDIYAIPSSQIQIPNKVVVEYQGPKDLPEFLEQIGCLKYLHILEEQDVDLRIFLTLTEADLKEKYEEVELLKGRVSQEQELRAVVEGFLMEDKIAWKQQQKQIEDTQRVCRELAIILEQIKACQCELSARFKDGVAQRRKADLKKQPSSVKEEGLANWKSVLGSLNISELSATLKDCTGEMGKTIQIVEQNLENLINSDKGSLEWRQNADI
ncbi:ankyrin repeat and SAM domain-containing protein 3 isoform X3 [Hemiscyllium ocellatum]|uniref:ankyrin repeat and SAM domain-containing protein 3 isoform X3 n=1 Tax=Hemiscyllium ocellatum TaxID=170820 RepID=UPI0029670D7A|nr:ankyrin repeat and SAM domain-containing protein 3 isoform X3 [Hemiscyllium ocellatum]